MLVRGWIGDPKSLRPKSLDNGLCLKKCPHCDLILTNKHNYREHVNTLSNKGCRHGLPVNISLELHQHHKTLNHPIVSELMYTLYMQQPVSHKYFYPWDVKWLLSLLESWAPASSLTNFKLPWKATTLLALVTAKCCFDLSFLCVDNQHLFLQHCAAIFVPASGGREITWDTFHLKVILNLILMLIFVLCFT